MFLLSSDVLTARSGPFLTDLEIAARVHIGNLARGGLLFVIIRFHHLFGLVFSTDGIFFFFY